MSALPHTFGGEDGVELPRGSRADGRKKPDISVVIPVYNEQENIRLLWDELVPVLEDLDRPWEVIFVDDGSTDESRSRILEVMHRCLPHHTRRVHLIRFEENLGQSAALWAGFGHVRSNVVITLDADLQNDPRDIPCLLSALAEADAVIGWRHPRRDSLVRRVSSRIGSLCCAFATGEFVHDTASSFRVFRKACLPALYPFKGLHRFIPALFKISGAEVIEMKVHHRPRVHGQSKYGIWNRVFPVLIDCFGVRWMKQRSVLRARRRH